MADRVITHGNELERDMTIPEIEEIITD